MKLLFPCAVVAYQKFNPNQAGTYLVDNENVWCDFFKRNCEIYDHEKGDIIDLLPLD